MKQIILAIILGAGLAHSGMAQTNVINKATRLEDKGKFKEAAELLKKAIDSKKYSGDGEKALEFQLDLLHRIKQDYSLSKEDFFAALKKEIKDFDKPEFERWIKDGWFDTREIDGKPYFFDSSVANLWFRHPELNARRFSPADKSAIDRWRLETVTSIEKASAAEHSPYVLPKTFHVNMRVTAKADAVPDGDIVRTWIPIPRQYPFQDNFKMLTTSLAPKEINPADSPIRSVYFEEAAQHGKPTEFKIEYEYTVHGVHFDLKPDKIQPYDPNDEAVKLFTRESPHVVFTPEIKQLSARIVGRETNPMLKARKIFDWLSDSLLYSYATEYSTIPNISDYCRSHGYGDCGQQGMLFITLCRYNGVPARWQSGWDLTPASTSNHDWAEIYLAPYGWVPVDQYMGNHAMRYIKTLTPAQVLEIRDFYFGGLDQYRMIANSDHSVALSPAKKFFRSDDVDFQRGEVEDSAKNLYFDDFSYKLTYKETPSPRCLNVLMKLSEQKRALTCAVKAARAAGKVMRQNLWSAKKINSSTHHDIKLELDVRCQKLIEKILLAGFPRVAVLGEEGVSGDPKAAGRWVVDPIDGTVNFAFGVPHACVCVALQIKGPRGREYETVVGVVYDPFCDELWTAIRGQPARLNGKIIHVSRRNNLREAAVSIGFAKSRAVLDLTLPYFNKLVRRVRKVRIMGAAGLAMTYVATGRFDAYVERGIRLWDIAAGGLIVECAGGEFWREPVAGRHTYRMVTSNGLLRKQLQALA